MEAKEEYISRENAGNKRQEDKIEYNLVLEKNQSNLNNIKIK